MRMVQKRFHRYLKNASLRAKIYIGQPTKYSTRGDAF